jgi:hypothetical protein
MSRKRLTIFAVLVIVALLLVMAVPVGATPSEPVIFHTEITYFLNDLDSGTGNWNTGELSGEATESSDNAGYYQPDWPGWRVRTFHNETVLSDENGSIIIKSQMHVTYFDPFYMEYVGNWTIISGDGDYEDLHGSGTYLGFGEVDLFAGILTGYTDYTGNMHLDP